MRPLRLPHAYLDLDKLAGVNLRTIFSNTLIGGLGAGGGGWGAVMFFYNKSIAVPV